jgi:hypothetical protein
LIDWQFVHSDEFERFRAAWDSINADGPKTPLLDSAFINSALRHFGDRNQMLAIGEKGGRPVAMALFNRGHIAKIEMFQPSQLPIGPYVGATASLREVSESLVESLPFHCVLASFTQLDSLFFDPIDQQHMRTVPHIQTGFIDLPPTSQEYLAGRPEGKYRKVTKRIGKAESLFGAVRVAVHTSREDIADEVQLFSDMETAGWKGVAGSALRRGGKQEKFYIEALKHFSERGEGRIFKLFFGERLVAMQLAVERGHTLYFLKSSYDEGLKHLSPGFALKKFTLKYLFETEKHIKRVEFYGKVIEAHRVWITGTRDIFHLNLYRSQFIARAHEHARRKRL